MKRPKYKIQNANNILQNTKAFNATTKLDYVETETHELEVEGTQIQEQGIAKIML